MPPDIPSSPRGFPGLPGYHAHQNARAAVTCDPESQYYDHRATSRAQGGARECDAFCGLPSSAVSVVTDRGAEIRVCHFRHSSVRANPQGHTWHQDGHQIQFVQMLTTQQLGRPRPPKRSGVTCLIAPGE